MKKRISDSQIFRQLEKVGNALEDNDISQAKAQYEIYVQMLDDKREQDYEMRSSAIEIINKLF